MNILYIAHRIPYPPNKGDKIRAYHQLRALAEIGNVFLCALVDETEDWQYQTTLESFCKEVKLIGVNSNWKKVISLSGMLRRKPMSVLYFHEKHLQEKIDVILQENKIDVICCFSGTSAEYLYCSRHAEWLFSTNRKKPLLIMDFCDVDSLKWQEYGKRSSFPFSYLYNQEGRLLNTYEKEIVRKFDTSIIITENEKALFRENVNRSANPLVIGNGVDLEYFNPEMVTSSATCNDRKGTELLFVGAMDYRANVDGVCWFAEAVWPQVLNYSKNTIFTIAGRNPTRAVQLLHGKKNILVTGAVEDIRPYYQSASIVVVPLRIARGIQNKVLEAMAMGKAVVSTTNAATGIIDHEGHGVQIQDNPHEFAKAITSLIGDKITSAKSGAQNRAYVEKYFNWSTNLEVLKKLCSKTFLECKDLDIKEIN